MNYLLDTCVVSEYLRKSPNESVIEWIDEQSEQTLYLSQLTIAELQKGCFKLLNKTPIDENKARAYKITRWIAQLERRFGDRILPMDAETLNCWSRLCGESEAQGQKLPVVDSLIAATALANGLVVVTRNVKDFHRCSPQLEIFNPFQ